jgi:alpha-tubulin suppressor-like RCC1 family protein
MIKMSTNIQKCLNSFVCIVAFANWGCGSNDVGTAQDTENVASTQLAVTNVPTGVLCVKVVVTVGSQTVNPPALTVTAGASSVALNLGQLPAGNASFQANAYNVACASVTTSTVASWIADPTSATLMPGYVANVPITFHPNNNVSLNANFVGNVAEFYTGTEASFARMSDGTVTQWGIQGTNFSLTPNIVPSLTNVVQVSAGYRFACARKSDGTVWCWGFNKAGVLGPNIAQEASTTTPQQIPLGSPALTISAGAYHVCAILGSSNLYCWGSNADGEFGGGVTLTNTPTPYAIRGLVSTVSAGYYHTCITDAGTGAAYCSGNNMHGQLGNGSTTNSRDFVQVTSTGATIAMAAGLYHTCFLGADNLVRCAGYNAVGCLGDGTTTDRLSPVAVVGLSNVVQIQAGYMHSCALSGGVVSCWGNATSVGTGASNNQLTPVVVPGLSNAIAIHTNMGNHACAEQADHSVKCWGSNTYGQIGNGNAVYAAKPTLVVF